MRCVCASLLLCVTQLNMKGEGIWVVRVGRLRSHNLCSHERHFSSLCLSLTFSLGFLMGLLLCCRSTCNSSTAECRQRARKMAALQTIVTQTNSSRDYWK